MVPVVVTGRGRRVGGAAGLRLAGIIVAAVGLILAAVFSLVSWPPWADLRLDRQGQPADATIVSAPVVVSSRRGVPNRVRLEVELASGPATGRTVTLTASPSADFRPGTSLRVEYLAEDPALARLIGGSYGIFGLRVIIPLLALSGVGLVLFAAGMLAGTAKPR